MARPPNLAPARAPLARFGPAALVAAAACAAWLPLLTPRLLGGVDAHWYASALADFLQQFRHGRFPVLVGQGRFGWNGAVHPLRSAPVYFWVAALEDTLTGHRLGAPALQHLTVLTSAVAGSLGFLAAGRALAPRRLAEVLALTLLYAWSAPWLSIIYWTDAYMTFMAFMALPLVFYGNARTLLDEDGRGYAALAAGLALVWMCHPLIATLASLATFIIQLGSFLCGRLDWARVRGALGGAALFGALSAFYFSSVADLPGADQGSPVPALLQLSGAALFLAGLSLGLLRRRAPVWLAGLAAGGLCLGLSSPPWLCWMAFSALFAIGAAAAARRWRWFDPAERCCELLLPSLLAGAALAETVLGPARTGGDQAALRALADNAALGSGWAWPIPGSIAYASDYRLGPGLWLVFALLAACSMLGKPRAPKLFFSAAVFGALGLLRIPLVSDFLCGTYPAFLQSISNFPFDIRLAPALAALVAFGGLVALAAGPPRRPWAALLLWGGAAWSGVEAEGFLRRGWAVTSTQAAGDQLFQDENVHLYRYDYNLLPLPAYFSEGVLDPRLEMRLLDPEQNVVVGPDDVARRMELGGSRVLALAARQDPTASRWLMIEPGLTLAPGERDLLRFDFDPNRNYAGYLIFHSENGYREYQLPFSGEPKAFGSAPGTSRVVSLWNSTGHSQHYALSMQRDPGNDVIAHGPFFARLVVSRFQPGRSPLRLESLDPYVVSTETDRPGLLETGVVFLPGYRATLDGRPVGALASRQRLVAVALPAGRHRLELGYAAPRAVRAAGAVSAAAWAGVLLAGLRFRPRRQQAADPAGPSS